LDLFGFIPGYTDVIYGEGKEPLFLLLVAFVVTFCLTRGYTRLARRHGWGSASVSGVHLHHIVPGIVLVLASGLISFTRAGDAEILHEVCAIVFGVGAAFILDEFALVFYLKDVYWSKQGEDSVDAAILGVMLAGLLLVSSEPFRLDQPTGHPGRLTFFAVVAANVGFAAVTFLKGKLYAGTAAILVPAIGWVGAFRLAKPSSPWARWFYDPHKHERALRRAQTDPFVRFQQRLVLLVGGQPSRSPPPYG
jgi:hypothetical protein